MRAEDMFDHYKKMRNEMSMIAYQLSHFSGISEEPLLINKIIHKTQVDVTETGTEFAAATALTMVFGSANPTEPELKRVTVDLNRPFLYVIRETTSGAILLMGAIKQ